MISPNERYAVIDRKDGYEMRMKYSSPADAQGVVNALQKALGGQWEVRDTRPDEEQHALAVA